MMGERWVVVCEGYEGERGQWEYDYYPCVESNLPVEFETEVRQLFYDLWCDTEQEAVNGVYEREDYFDE